jgi:hypothetical protein
MAEIKMDSSAISAVAALAGAAAGGTASFLASWLGQQRQVRAQWVAQDKLHRQNLYKEFIEQSSECYLHALQHHQPDILALVAMYTKTSEMRVISSPDVLAAAEDVVQRVIATYSKADITFADIDLAAVVQDGSFDLLRDFSESCRAEFDHLRTQQL